MNYLDDVINTDNAYSECKQQYNEYAAELIKCGTVKIA